MSAKGQLSAGLVLVAAVFAAFAAGGDAGYGLVTAALVLAFLLLVYFGRRRSDTLDVMSGIGDERGRLLYTRAVAFSGTVMSFVLPIWWLVTVAQGNPNEVLSISPRGPEQHHRRRRSAHAPGAPVVAERRSSPPAGGKTDVRRPGVGGARRTSVLTPHQGARPTFGAPARTTRTGSTGAAGTPPKPAPDCLPR
jgi:hypothetical protein